MCNIIKICSHKLLCSKFSIIGIILLSISFSACEREVSVTPPDQPPPDGSIFLDTNPPEMKIFVDGRDRRRITPDSIKWLTTGDYSITLKRDYFRDTTFVVHVEEGTQTQIYIDYLNDPSMLGNLFCQSTPSGAVITIDDSNTTRTTPYHFTNLTPGDHVIKLEKTNFRTKEIVVAVRSGETSNLQTPLVDLTKWNDYNAANLGFPTDNFTCVLSAMGWRGALWIGTYNAGLIKYANGEWITYDQTNSLISHDHIICIEQDSAQNIWTGTEDGLTQIKPNRLHTEARHDDEVIQWNFRNSTLLSMEINAVGTTEGNVVWFGTQIGITQLLMSDEYFWGTSVSSSTSGLPADQITAFAVDGMTKYVGTQSGLVTFANPQNMTLYNTSNGLYRNSISAVAVDQNSVVWIGHKSSIGASGGLSVLIGSSLGNYSHFVNGENVNTIYVDSENRKWIGTDRALYLVINMSVVAQYYYDTTGLPIKNVTGVTEDKDGIIWISTFGEGLFSFNVNNL